MEKVLKMTVRYTCEDYKDCKELPRILYKTNYEAISFNKEGFIEFNWCSITFLKSKGISPNFHLLNESWIKSDLSSLWAYAKRNSLSHGKLCPSELDNNIEKFPDLIDKPLINSCNISVSIA